jgi:aspartate carbamoyltransferase catalytic subunit
MRHLLSIADLDRAGIERILDRAKTFTEVSEREIKKVPALRGRRVLNLFYEASTRTRSSFELAAKSLSADVINFASSGSSVEKGESLKDTVQTMSAYQPDLIVIRSPHVGAAALVAGWTTASVVNAGDGAHEHPTQALLDIFTIRKRLGRVAGLTVALVGDIAHSRVARSNIHGLKALGAHVIVCGPTTLIPAEAEGWGVEVAHNLDAILPRCDVVNLLRIQFERQRSGLFPSIREYRLLFGMDGDRMRRAKDGVLLLAPGPINRGVEITPDVADGKSSAILDQVTNGLAVRMGVLSELCKAA